MNLRVAAALILVTALILQTGCADPPPPRSASKEIKDAEDSIYSAENWQSKGKLTQALADYRQAKESITAGRAFAEGKELTKLKTMDEEVRHKITDLDTQVMVQPDAPAPKPAATVKIVDAGETIKKAEDAKRQSKIDADKKEAQDLAAKLATNDVKVSKKQDEPEDAAKPVAKAGKEDPKDGTDAEPAEAKKKGVGIFPALSEKSPPVEVIKLVTRGKYMFAYFQLYNKTDTGKRIVAVNVFYKDKDNQLLKEPTPVVAVFPYVNFKEDAKDPIEQPSVTALTNGSGQVPGMEGVQFVAVGEHEKANTCKKVAVRVIYEPGPSEVGTGPEAGAINEGGANNGASVIKALK